jgi:hypothetical protein
MRKNPAVVTNQAQRKYLDKRFRDARSEKLTQASNHEDGPMPPEIRRARLVIRQWEAAKYRKTKARRDRVHAACAKIEQRILFGTPAEALAAVEAFEKLKVV